MRPRDERMAAFLRRAWGRHALARGMELAAFGNAFERSGEARDRIWSLFGSRFRLSCDREVRRMVDAYGWEAVAERVPIDLCDRLCHLAMAEECAAMEAEIRESQEAEERSARMGGLQALWASPECGPLRGRTTRMMMLDDDCIRLVEERSPAQRTLADLTTFGPGYGAPMGPGGPDAPNPAFP